MIDFTRVKALIWDLDNTLYRVDDALYNEFHKCMAQAAIALGLDLPYEEAVAISNASFETHNFSGHDFVHRHGIDRVLLHDRFHEIIDETFVQVPEGNDALFEQLDLPHALVTHGARPWANRVLERLNLSRWFESRVFAAEDYHFEKKSASRMPFDMALAALKIPARNALFVEDVPHNLKIAHEIGMQTVLIHHGEPLRTPPRYVAAQYDSAASLLHDLIQSRNKGS